MSENYCTIKLIEGRVWIGFLAGHREPKQVFLTDLEPATARYLLGEWITDWMMKGRLPRLAPAEPELHAE
jgi:hypothetical protein